MPLFFLLLSFRPDIVLNNFKPCRASVRDLSEPLRISGVVGILANFNFVSFRFLLCLS